MIHAGKLLARLNPRSPRYTIGNGGVPEFTPADIADAIGRVGAATEDGYGRRVPGDPVLRLGREILCHIWWPDGAALTRNDLLRQLWTLQLGEWTLRARRLEAALLAEHLRVTTADRAHGWMHGTLRPTGRDLGEARAMMWPRISLRSLYESIRLAVLEEIIDPHRCARCAGRAQVKVDQLVILCPECKGSGHSRTSDRARARAIGRGQKTYLEAWCDPYEWLLAECVSAERKAAREFTDVLGMTEPRRICA